MLTHVLLDLDGTLVDSAPAVLGTLRAAIAEVGADHRPEEINLSLLGPSLYATLPPIVGDEATPEVMRVYRRLYPEMGPGLTTVYPRIDALLTALVEEGVRIALATSKAETSARAVLADNGWTDLFTEIVGDTPDAGRPTKALVVGEALRRLEQPSGSVMVGDRFYDVVGARECGLDCHGAGWGYAEPGELTEAGAVAVHASADELRTALLG